MSAVARPDPYAPTGVWRALESAAAGLLALLWVLPLAYAAWAAFHAGEFTTRFTLLAPLTLENFERAWAGGAVRALLPQHLHSGDLDPGLPARALHARGLRLRALRFYRQQCGLRAGCWRSS